jgi:hypothetical protein
LERLSEQYRVINSVTRVSIEDYYQEMRRSRICISPFGYGEICHRDFEAIICGCLLIKPDMSHVEANPDIFRPYQTYVPVQWDFADLVDKCSYYLNNDDECRRIADQAFGVLEQFYKGGGMKGAILNQLQQLVPGPR